MMKHTFTMLSLKRIGLVLALLVFTIIEATTATMVGSSKSTTADSSWKEFTSGCIMTMHPSPSSFDPLVDPSLPIIAKTCISKKCSTADVTMDKTATRTNNAMLHHVGAKVDSHTRTTRMGGSADGGAAQAFVDASSTRTNTDLHHAGEPEPPKTTGSAGTGTGANLILFDRQDNNNNDTTVPKTKKIKKTKKHKGSKFPKIRSSMD